MTNTNSIVRLLTGAAFIVGMSAVAGCGHTEKVTRSTTTEQTSTAVPAPVTSSTTTTTTRQTNQ